MEFIKLAKYTEIETSNNDMGMPYKIISVRFESEKIEMYRMPNRKGAERSKI